jgi:hypothetical protein
MHAAANAVRYARYVIWRKTMSEPREDDDIALDKDGECEDCGNFIFECVCNIPDEPYDVVYAD